MKKVTQNKDQKRVLATKKLSSEQASKSASALKFRQVSATELSANRNSAYAYIVR